MKTLEQVQFQEQGPGIPVEFYRRKTLEQHVPDLREFRIRAAWMRRWRGRFSKQTGDDELSPRYGRRAKEVEDSSEEVGPTEVREYARTGHIGPSWRIDPDRCVVDLPSLLFYFLSAVCRIWDRGICTLDVNDLVSILARTHLELCLANCGNFTNASDSTIVAAINLKGLEPKSKAVFFTWLGGVATTNVFVKPSKVTSEATGIIGTFDAEAE
ncbi:hypothetical protein BDK51DRAFT_26228 [Blyttiomyces helicus]|uniref:Uncharacterized protein n=1 Tax=Blyttiomyces helicus TaxID=388810 RepID=A0A4P9W101_9FUNG|nr:hypothetical protein BDK51DRAFT_26228 [Blyttiomyces helicus]|eukprot:RKO85839.1 hypothetical protein BDK51DRAFT_26228 [Blyttiomyces helicus]